MCTKMDWKAGRTCDPTRIEMQDLHQPDSLATQPQGHACMERGAEDSLFA